MKQHVWSILIGFLLWVIVANPALADSEKEDSIPIMDETLVTATRTETPVRELGVSATVVTEKEIEERQAVDVIDVLKDVSGFNLVRTGGRGTTTSLYIRGGEDNFTKVLIDGVSVNLGGGAYDFGSLLTENFERIEIVRGPQSALYGSDAISGVINFITKPGEGKPSLRASSSNGTYLKGDKNYIGEQSVGFTGGNEWIGASLAYARVDDNGYLEVNQDYWNNTFSGRVDVTPMDNFDLTFTGRYEDAKDKFPTGDAGDKYSPLDPNQDLKTDDWVSGVNAQYRMLPWLEHAVLLGYHYNKQDYNDPEDPTADPFGAFFSETKDTRYSVDYHFNIRYPSTETMRSTFTAGFEYLDEDYDQQTRSIFLGVETKDDLNKDRDNWGYYVQEQLSFFNHLHFTAGARYEDNSEFGTEFVPRGSVAYELTQTDTTFRGAAGKGFKTPTFTEQFAQGFATGNPDLDPEKSYSWEVGVDQVLWKNKLVLGATYFYQKFDDLITYINRPAPAPDFENIQEAKSQGVELTALCKPGYGFTLGANYTYLDTEVEDDGGAGGASSPFEEGKQLLRRPKNTASGYINWAWKGFQIRFDGLYVGERDDLDFRTFPADRVTLDDYFIVDLATSYTFQLNNEYIKDFKIFGKVLNLFDEHYEEAFGFSPPDPSFRVGLAFKL
ncbi:MAG: TonB-dependent receptor plug domain-containing protein [Desulfobacterales bacterium]